MSHSYRALQFSLLQCSGDGPVSKENYGKLVDNAFHLLDAHIDHLDLVRLDLDHACFIADEQILTKYNREMVLYMYYFPPFAIYGFFRELLTFCRVEMMIPYSFNKQKEVEERNPLFHFSFYSAD